MSKPAASTIITHFADLEDPQRYNWRHKLLDIVVIAICAVICGADDWCGVEEFGLSKGELPSLKAGWDPKYLSKVLAG